MTVLRILHNRENPYVQLNKKVLEDPNISLKAKGLWAFCLTKPNDWQFSIAGLTSQLKEEKTAIYSAINELIDNKYAVRVQHRQKNDTGKQIFGKVEYIMFEFKLTPQEEEKFKKFFPRSGFPRAENRPQVNNEYTKEYIKKDNVSIGMSKKEDTPKKPLPPSMRRMSIEEKACFDRIRKIKPCIGKAPESNAILYWIQNWGIQRVYEALATYLTRCDEAEKNKTKYPRSMGAYIRNILNKDIRPPVKDEEKNREYAESKAKEYKFLKPLKRYVKIKTQVFSEEIFYHFEHAIFKERLDRIIASASDYVK